MLKVKSTILALLSFFVILPILILPSLVWPAEIHDAVQNGELEKVKALLEKDTQLINAQDDFKSTPLHLAAEEGHLEIARLLIAKGAALDPGNAYGMTPLHMSSAWGRLSIAELLLEKGAVINCKDAHGKTPLHWAAAYDQDKLLELLITKGADKEGKDIFGRTPLEWSAWNGKLKVTNLLIQKGAHVNAKDAGGDTALHGAAYEGHKEIAELLIAKGADVNAKNKKGRAAFDNALRRGHKDIQDLLAAKGGKSLSRWSEEPAKTPLSRKNPEGEKETVKCTILIDNYSFSEGTTPEWGFSCLIEGMEKTILFDTGPTSEALLHNIERLKVDLKRVKLLVISHDHTDHTGGLSAVLAKNHNLSAYIPDSSSYGTMRAIEDTGAQVFAPLNQQEISRNIYLTGEMGSRIKEQSLILNTSKGLVIITGCAHQGIMDVLKKAKEMFDRNIYLVFGGFHLLDKSEEEIDTIIAHFKEMGVQKCGATHCTGPKGIEMFKKAYGDHYIEMGTGRVITISE